MITPSLNVQSLTHSGNKLPSSNKMGSIAFRNTPKQKTVSSNSEADNPSQIEKLITNFQKLAQRRNNAILDLQKKTTIPATVQQKIQSTKNKTQATLQNLQYIKEKLEIVSNEISRQEQILMASSTSSLLFLNEERASKHLENLDCNIRNLRGKYNTLIQQAQTVCSIYSQSPSII